MGFWRPTGVLAEHIGFRDPQNPIRTSIKPEPFVVGFPRRKSAFRCFVHAETVVGVNQKGLCHRLKGYVLDANGLFQSPRDAREAARSKMIVPRGKLFTVRRMFLAAASRSSLTSTETEGAVPGPT